MTERGIPWRTLALHRGGRTLEVPQLNTAIQVVTAVRDTPYLFLTEERIKGFDRFLIVPSLEAVTRDLLATYPLHALRTIRKQGKLGSSLYLSIDETTSDGARFLALKYLPERPAGSATDIPTRREIIMNMPLNAAAISASERMIHDGFHDYDGERRRSVEIESTPLPEARRQWLWTGFRWVAANLLSLEKDKKDKDGEIILPEDLAS